MTPTQELYAALQTAYDHFNEQLFDEQLPLILFTIQRQRGMMGYFSPDRWGSSKGKSCHEIAINPLYVGRATLIELMQTLVHEMTHCWQHCFATPSRMSYHNKEWSDKMVSMGLMPSSTGKLGGKRVGQTMNDYPLPNGPFITECVSLLNNKKFTLPWIDKLSAGRKKLGGKRTQENALISAALTGIDDKMIGQLTIRLNTLLGDQFVVLNDLQAAKKVKVRYTCLECSINVWGKGDLSLRCDDCDSRMVESI